MRGPGCGRSGAVYGCDREMKILLEGRPAAGKTTVVRRLAELLRDAGVVLGGFVTDELREGRRRVGFSVETFDGNRTVLAHVDFDGLLRVGKYGVDVAAFERVALPALARAAESDVLLIDELGKMELASDAFRAAVDDCFGRAAAIVATVQLARHPLTDKLKSRSDVETIRVTTANRGELPAQLAERILRR
jgi:nucleoside-triphosphatase